MRPPRETDVLITDSREGLFLIRLLGLMSSPQPDSLSGGLERPQKEGGRGESQKRGGSLYIQKKSMRESYKHSGGVDENRKRTNANAK